MAAQILRLTSNGNQSFEAVVSVDGSVQTFFCNLRYNEIADYWVLTIKNSQNVVLLDSVPFITGNIPSGNLLHQFSYLKIGSISILNVAGVATPDFPNGSDLGTDFQLLWHDTGA